MRSAASTSSGLCSPMLRDLFERSRNVAVFVQIADDRFGGVAHRLAHHSDAQLCAQMLPQRNRRGKKGLERRLFDRFRRRALISGVQIVVEKGAEIDFVEGIGRGGRFQQRIRRDSHFRFGHRRCGRFLRIGEYAAVDGDIGQRSIEGAGRIENGGVQDFAVRRVGHALGLEQRQ